MNSLASLLALVSLVLFCNGQPLSDIDDMCPRLTNILCVRDVLMAIASVAKNLNRTLNHIEDQIHSNGLVAESFNRYIQHERTVIYSHLATPQYHSNFFRTNNIDQVRRSFPRSSSSSFFVFCSEISRPSAHRSALFDEFLLQLDQRCFELERRSQSPNRHLVETGSSLPASRNDLSVSKHSEHLLVPVAGDRQCQSNRIFQTAVSRHFVVGSWRSLGHHSSTLARMDATHSSRLDQHRTEIRLIQIDPPASLSFAFSSIKIQVNAVAVNSAKERSFVRNILISSLSRYITTGPSRFKAHRGKRRSPALEIRSLIDDRVFIFVVGGLAKNNCLAVQRTC